VGDPEQPSSCHGAIGGYPNSGEVFQGDVVISSTVGERHIIAGLAHGVRVCTSVVGGGCV
jgi:hypothetical protein